MSDFVLVVVREGLGDGTRRGCGDGIRGGCGDGTTGGVGNLAPEERVDDPWPADDGRRTREELLCWRSDVEDRGVSKGRRLVRSVDERVIEGISLMGAGLLGI